MTSDQGRPHPATPSSVTDEHPGGEAGPRSTGDDVTGEGRKRFFLRRDFLVRVAVGVPVGVSILVLAFQAPPIVIALLSALAGVYGTYEYAKLFEKGLGVRLPLPALLASAALIGGSALTGNAEALHGGLLAGVLLITLPLFFLSGPPGVDIMKQAGISLTGLLLVPWLINHISLIIRLPSGGIIFAFIVMAVACSDTWAYLIGSLFGRHPLIPAVSPNKTVEGALGGLSGGVLAALLAWLWMRMMEISAGIGLPVLVGWGILLAVAGMAGDLMESRLKRITGMKDSGVLLPGHGGLLDRMDSFLLAVPVCYYLIRLYSLFGGDS